MMSHIGQGCKICHEPPGFLHASTCTERGLVQEPQENKDLTFDFRTLDDPSFVSHWMLQDPEVAAAIGKTADFRASRALVARVTVNGVVLPFDSLEKMFEEFYERLEKKAAERYADVEKEVQRRLEERLKGDAKLIVEKMWELQQVLEDAGSILKPHWED